MVMPICLEAAIRILFIAFKHLWPFNFPAGWGSFGNFANIGTLIILFILIMLIKSVVQIDYPGFNYGTIAGLMISLFGFLIQLLVNIALPFFAGISFIGQIFGATLGASAGALAGMSAIIIGIGWVILLISSEANIFVKIAAAPLVFLTGIVLASIELVLLIFGAIAKPVVSALYGSLIGSKFTVNILGLGLILVYAYILYIGRGFVAGWICTNLSTIVATFT